MRDLIFGSACMVSGLLLAILMLLVGEFPNAYDGLSPLGKAVLWIGVIAAVLGVVICVSRLNPGQEET